MDLQFVATLTPGANTAASYFVNDNIGGAAFDHEFNVVIFNTAANFVGTSVADVVFGSATADEFRSNGAGDMFEGGAGDDLYRVYSADTKVFEVAGGGTDRIASGVSYVLAAGVQLELMTTNGSTGTAKIDLTGNSLSQTIYGNAGDNTLHDGGAGSADTLAGMVGDDTYRVFNAGDKIVEGKFDGANDRVMAAVDYVLTSTAYVEFLVTNGTTGTAAIDLTGNGLGQMLIGNNGNNILDGKAGADTMRGLAGDDTYYVDHLGDRVQESINQGTDTVLVGSLTNDFILTKGTEVEVISVIDQHSTFLMNLNGNEFAQSLYGNDAENSINGGGGADFMEGFGGSDTYWIDDAGDIVDESTGTGIFDAVTGAISISLENATQFRGLIENAYLQLFDNLDLTGNALVNVLTGNAGNNIIDGRGGSDALLGRTMEPH